MHDEAIQILLTLHHFSHHWNMPDLPKAYRPTFDKIDAFVAKWMPEKSWGFNKVSVAGHDLCANPNCKICRETTA